MRPFSWFGFLTASSFAQMAAVVGAEAVEDTEVAAEGMEVAAEGMAVVVGEEVAEEEATAAAGEVAGAGEDAKATGFALTRGAHLFLSLSLWN